MVEISSIFNFFTPKSYMNGSARGRQNAVIPVLLPVGKVIYLTASHVGISSCEAYGVDFKKFVFSWVVLKLARRWRRITLKEHMNMLYESLYYHNKACAPQLVARAGRWSIILKP